VLGHQGEPYEVGPLERPVEGLGVVSVSKLEIQMKKTWVALAVAGAFFAGAAQAQSSVTLYGILDVNYMWQEAPTNMGTTAAPRIQQESYSAINGGYQSGNRWGLRGSEDLGGGMSAIFTLESGFNIDTGTMGQGSASASSGRLFGRQAWAGISTNFGAVVAGRLATFSSGTGSFDMWGRVDPFLTGFGLASLGSTFISSNALRVDNAIAYQSPKFAGFQAGLGYTTRVDGAEVAPSDANTSAFISAINWEMGPFFVSVTYDVANGATPVGGSSAPDQKHLQIGGTFDLGPVRFHAAYADQSNIGAVPNAYGGSGAFVTLPAGFDYDNSAWMLGLTWKLGAFTLMGSYQASNADGRTINGVNFEPDYNVYGIGATYNLSRRTNLYAGYASRDANGTLAGNSFNYKQLALGMRHLF
jgi:predicted porin